MSVRPTPLPVAQIGVLCVINAGEGVAMNIIWSYVPFLVGQWYSDDQLGFYVGLLASSFFVTQALSALWWGKLADRFGRRYILLCGVFGSALSMALFGWSVSYAQCVAGRLCAGLLNGNSGIVKSYLGEITDSTNRAKGFSYLSLVWGVTSILAPAAGGFLAKPADNWSLFDNEYWRSHPYLLPSLLSMMVSVTGATVGYFYLPESPKWLERQRLVEHVEVDEAQQPAEQAAATATTTTTTTTTATGEKGETTALLGSAVKPPCCPRFYSLTVHVCLLYSVLGFSMTQFDELIPLLGEEKINQGGLSFSSSQIGLLLSIGGGTLLFYQGLLFPVVARRIGPHKGFTVGMLLVAAVIVIFPTVAQVRKVQLEVGREWYFWVYYTLLVFAQKAFSSSAFTFSMMLINDSTPPGKLGTTHGLAQSMVAFARIFSPTLAGGLWAYSMQLRQLAPYAPFIPCVTVAACCLLGATLSCFLPPVNPEGFEVL